MRFIPFILIVAAGIALSGCAVVGAAADVTGAAAGAAATVVSTTVGVTGDVVGAAAHTVTGGSGDKAKDKDSH
jgi:uncharacterized protein YceK